MYKRTQVAVYSLGTPQQFADFRERVEELENEHGWEWEDWKIVGRDQDGVNIIVKFVRLDDDEGNPIFAYGTAGYKEDVYEELEEAVEDD